MDGALVRKGFLRSVDILFILLVTMRLSQLDNDLGGQVDLPKFLGKSRGQVFLTILSIEATKY